MGSRIHSSFSATFGKEGQNLVKLNLKPQYDNLGSEGESREENKTTNPEEPTLGMVIKNIIPI
jgi:hypothetical protein